MPRRSARTVTTVDKESLFKLLEVLLKDYEVIAPTAKQAGIMFERIGRPDELARSYRDFQVPGEYRLQKDGDGTIFRYSNGQNSLKWFLHPPEQLLFKGELGGGHGDLVEEPGPARPVALFALRACDIAALEVLDRVFLLDDVKDSAYRKRREGAFVVALSCTEPGDLCFCSSMGTGPRPWELYDLNLVELSDRFLVEARTDKGRSVLTRLPSRPANKEDRAIADRLLNEAAGKMGRHLNTQNLPEILLDSLEHPYWDVMKNWCVGCANCTMVCPTCFCNTIYDDVDINTLTVERQRLWETCFTLQFAQVHGWNFRDELRERYRHWLCHKLSYWVSQYGVFGCVGCGRCLAWCPVRIDITQVAATVRGSR
ncbi:MAG: 4Fe-4S dicluster domain-containing protein [Chloroflexi bacterium]|nr:4Fe-4S dicluster domain-containing protein [Chloroflexota bacterium]